MNATTITALLTEIAPEFGKLRAEGTIIREENNAAAHEARAFVTTDGRIEIGLHYPNTTYTHSDMERNHWVKEVTEEADRISEDDYMDAIAVAAIDAAMETPTVDEDSLANAYLDAAHLTPAQQNSFVITVNNNGWCYCQPESTVGSDETVIVRVHDLRQAEQLDPEATSEQVHEWMRCTNFVEGAQENLDLLVKWLAEEG